MKNIVVTLTVILVVGLSVSEASTCDFQEEDYVPTYDWLLSQVDENWGWNGLTYRVILALASTDFAKFDVHNDLKSQLSVKQMEIELLSPSSTKSDIALMSGGKLGFYINALLSVCKDPADFYGHDLVRLLKFKMIRYPVREFRNLFQYSQGLLALCNADRLSIRNWEVRKLIREQRPDGSFLFGKDVVSMASQAMSCVSAKTEGPTKEQIDMANKKAIDYLLSKQDAEGLFGNAHSTGLAMQALLAAGVDQALWNCSRTLDALKALGGQDSSFGSLFTAVEALPALNGKTYILDLSVCEESVEATTTSLPTMMASVNYTVIDAIGNTVSSWKIVSVPENSTCYEMMVAGEEPGTAFEFEASESEYGHFITSIAGIESDYVNNYYWFLYYKTGSGADEVFSDKGVDSLIVGDNWSIIWRYEQYQEQ